MLIKTVFREPNLQCIDFILRQNILLPDKKLYDFQKILTHFLFLFRHL